MTARIGLQRLNKMAILPKKATPGASGYDLYSAEEYTLYPGQYKALTTGWNIAMSEDIEVQVRPRSGLAAKHGVTVLNSPGTIDSDYTGEMKVILINHGSEKLDIKVGDRIAQMVPSALIVEISDDPMFFSTLKADSLRRSDRGEGGFGSTGK